MTELLAPVLSIVRTGERHDRFTASLPAYKAACIVKAEVGFILESLDSASKAESAEIFDVRMDTAHAAVLRARRWLSTLEAEITRGSQTASALVVSVTR